MDLNKLDTIKAANKGMSFFVKDLDGVETDIEISVVGMGGSVHKEASAQRNYELAQLEKGKAPSTPAAITAREEAKEALYIECLAKCITGWKNLQENGKDIVFSTEKAVEILTNYPIVKHSVMEATGDMQAFLERHNLG